MNMGAFSVFRYGFPVLATVLLLGCAAPREQFIFQESPYHPVDQIEPESILHIPTGIQVSAEELFDLLAEKRIVYVGESHNNLAHHRIQLQIFKAMHSRMPGRMALGIEMFARPAQPILDRWVSGEIESLDFEREWMRQWGTDYDYYREILEFARDRNIPVVALNTGHQAAASAPDKDSPDPSGVLRETPPEMDATDPYHRQSMRAVFDGHTPTHSSGPDAFEPFYQAMLLWDETMAANITHYLNSPEGQNRHMMVMAGGFHVHYGFGIPRRVFRRLPVSYSTVLPFSDDVPEHLRMDVQPPDLPLYIADFVWKTPFEDLAKERAWLGIQMEPSGQGVTVTSVRPGMPAARGGLQEGDVILAFDGAPVGDPFDLIFLIGQKKPGDAVMVKFMRAGNSLEAEVRLESREHP